MTIIKRILCVFLVFVLCFCIVFQCSLTSYAVFGVDDALLIGAICLDLAACGVTIYSVSNFVQSDTFKDFTHELGANIDQQISVVKRNGELFFATTKLGWSMITNWVKRHFSGATEDRTIEYATDVTASPEFLICADGSTLPYQEWMEYPFFIYNSLDTPGRKWAYWVTETNAGMIVLTHSVQIYCYPKAQVRWGYFQNGQFHDNGQYNRMQDGLYKGQTGGYQLLDFNSNMYPNQSSWYQFRTIDIIMNSDSGALNPNFTTQTVPGTSEPGTASVDMHSDALKYPGAIDSPTTTIKDGEKVLVKVPEGMVVDNGNDDLTLTTNAETVGQVIADTTAGEVEAKVLTGDAVTGVDTVVDNVIADTPAQEIVGNAQADIETANKFRLPKSFLEGFPFSIPYSIFIGIKSFVAEAQAPVFDLPFVISRFGINETVHIDLERFSPLARLCRSFLSIVWVVGLALGSYKLIKH